MKVFDILRYNDGANSSALIQLETESETFRYHLDFQPWRLATVFEIYRKDMDTLLFAIYFKAILLRFGWAFQRRG